MTFDHIVLLSGGQDSTTCLWWAKRWGGASEEPKILALSFDYAQRHRIELERAAEIAAMAGAEHRTIKVDLAVPSFLTDGDTTERDGLPATFVPGRNLIFLAHAYAIAGATGARSIVFGANAIDYSGYPDCRPKFVDAMARAGAAALDRSVHLVAPLLHKTKAEIVRAGEELGVRAAIGRSWSCYDPRTLAELDYVPGQPGLYRAKTVPCGRCAACVLRAKGFDEAGITDPALERP